VYTIGYALVGPLASRIGIAQTIYIAATVNAAISIIVAILPAIRGLHANEEPTTVIAVEA
jgi:hypothetical protein